MPNSNNNYPFLFEEISKKILSDYGFNILPHPHNVDCDFSADYGGSTWIFEAKYYQYTSSLYSSIENASRKLSSTRTIPDNYKKCIIVSTYLTPDTRTYLEKTFQVSYFDIFDLYSFSQKHPKNIDQLNAIIGKQIEPTNSVHNRNYPSAHAPTAPNNIRPGPTSPSDGNFGGNDGSDNGGATPPQEQGKDLCTELRNLKPGMANWRKYEKLGEKIVKFLFDAFLDNWTPQKTTYDGLSRMDLISRIHMQDGLWSILQVNIGSRYIVFEFKNYSSEIKQSQILTTEKYLFHNGLRTVAIVLCRKGASASALKTMQGAMREQKKLIVCLDDDEICEMLHAKDNGDDVELILSNKIDTFLMSINR
jgi:hypothetical protein